MISIYVTQILLEISHLQLFYEVCNSMKISPNAKCQILRVSGLSAVGLSAQLKIQITDIIHEYDTISSINAKRTSLLVLHFFDRFYAHFEWCFYRLFLSARYYLLLFRLLIVAATILYSNAAMRVCCFHFFCNISISHFRYNCYCICLLCKEKYWFE